MELNIIPEMLGLNSMLPDVAGLGVSLPILLALASTLILVGCIARDEIKLARGEIL